MNWVSDRVRSCCVGSFDPGRNLGRRTLAECAVPARRTMVRIWEGSMVSSEGDDGGGGEVRLGGMEVGVGGLWRGFEGRGLRAIEGIGCLRWRPLSLYRRRDQRDVRQAEAGKMRETRLLRTSRADTMFWRGTNHLGQVPERCPLTTRHLFARERCFPYKMKNNGRIEAMLVEQLEQYEKHFAR